MNGNEYNDISNSKGVFLDVELGFVSTVKYLSREKGGRSSFGR
jgi:hypothetical protein